MLQVCERVWGISLVEVYERSWKSAISACKKSHLKLKARLIGQLRYTNLFAQDFDQTKIVFIRGWLEKLSDLAFLAPDED